MKNEPILSSDGDAVEQLQTKLAALTKQRDGMKAVNAAWRQREKKGDDSALLALGLTPEAIKRMSDKIASAYSWEKQPYVSWQLTNLGATIRSVEKRIAHLSVVQAQPEQKAEGNGIKYEDSPADNRVRLFFPGKPDAAVRSKLKSNGFRWTPSLGCWQAYRNYRAEMLAREFIAPTFEQSCAQASREAFSGGVNEDGSRADEINRGIGHGEPTPYDIPAKRLNDALHLVGTERVEVFPEHDDTNENAL